MWYLDEENICKDYMYLYIMYLVNCNVYVKFLYKGNNRFQLHCVIADNVKVFCHMHGIY